MDQQGNVNDSAKPLVNRRTVALGAAWSVPVIVLATAAPAAAASGDDRSAVLATVLGEKGEAVGANRQVRFTLSFGSTVVGSNSVKIISIDGGGPWAVLPTAAATVDPTTPDAVFMLTRPDNNASLDVVVHYTVNGVESTVDVTVKNKGK